MNKHDGLQARRALLTLWLQRLKKATADREREISDALRQHEIVDTPPIRLHVSGDMLKVLSDGLECAIAGNPDPFGLRAPKGTKPKLDRMQRIRLAAEIEAAISQGKSTDEAFASVGAKKKFNASVSTARDAYYELRDWAKIYAKVSKTRK